MAAPWALQATPLQARRTSIIYLSLFRLPALSTLLNGKAALPGDMALRIEKAFGVKMDTLMRMQSAYDIAKIRKREKEIRIRRILRTSAGPFCNS